MFKASCSAHARQKPQHRKALIVMVILRIIFNDNSMYIACSTHARQKPQHPKVRSWPTWPKLRKWALQWPRFKSDPWNKPYTLNPKPDMTQVAEMSTWMSQIPYYISEILGPQLLRLCTHLHILAALTTSRAASNFAGSSAAYNVFGHQWPPFPMPHIECHFGRWVHLLGLIAPDPPLYSSM